MSPVRMLATVFVRQDFSIVIAIVNVLATLRLKWRKSASQKLHLKSDGIELKE